MRINGKLIHDGDFVESLFQFNNMIVIFTAKDHDDNGHSCAIISVDFDGNVIWKHGYDSRINWSCIEKVNSKKNNLDDLIVIPQFKRSCLKFISGKSEVLLNPWICEHLIEFNSPVAEFIQTENSVVVLTWPTSRRQNKRNIRAYDFNGNLLWRIKDEPLHPDGVYLSIFPLWDPQKLGARDGSYFYELDPCTGEILREEYTK